VRVDAITSFARRVQFQGVVLVPVRLDVRHLEDGLLQDLEILGESRFADLAARPGFDLRHRAAPSEEFPKLLV
jgi:hypothetical protein